MVLTFVNAGRQAQKYTLYGQNHWNAPSLLNSDGPLGDATASQDISDNDMLLTLWMQCLGK